MFFFFFMKKEKPNYSNAYNPAFSSIIFPNVLLCIKCFINAKIYTHDFVHIDNCPLFKCIVINPYKFMNNSEIKICFLLSSAVRHAMAKSMEQALNDPKVTAVVICGENGRFCGG